MHIELQQIGKRFSREWIFRNVNLEIPAASKIAILGSNGSGKSTLLQIISGILSPNEGQIIYSIGDQKIPSEKIFSYFSIASPYLELVEEMSLKEMVNFHFSFKKRYQNISDEEFIEILGLEKSAEKEIRYFSSGMKQRTKLLLALLSDVPCVLLDEPTSNLDTQGVEWYHKIISQYINDRSLIICSNQESEYSMCTKTLNIMAFK